MRICTTNPGKKREFGSLLYPLGIELKTTDPSIVIEEPHPSFLDNAKEKAFGYHRHYPGEYLLVEDSGLVVPLLDGLPGPWSADFSDLDIETREVNSSGRGRSIIDPLNGERVLSLMEGKKERGAYFVAVILVCSPKGSIVFKVEERAYGWIAQEKRGENGFGYDPIFISPETYGKTWAEIDRGRKDLISHRNKAINHFMAWVCKQDGLDL